MSYIRHQSLFSFQDLYEIEQKQNIVLPLFNRRTAVKRVMTLKDVVTEGEFVSNMLRI